MRNLAERGVGYASKQWMLRIRLEHEEILVGERDRKGASGAGVHRGRARNPCLTSVMEVKL
jgi:hypothetical protein